MIKRGLVGLLILWFFWLAGSGPPVSAQTAASSGVPGRGSDQGTSSPPQDQTVTIQVDQTQLNNGGTLTVTGQAPPGKPVYLEIFAEKKVRANLSTTRKMKRPDKSLTFST